MGNLLSESRPQPQFFSCNLEQTRSLSIMRKCTHYTPTPNRTYSILNVRVNAITRKLSAENNGHALTRSLRTRTVMSP